MSVSILAGSALLTAAFLQAETSYFVCKDLGNDRYRPYWMEAVGDDFRDWSQTPKGLLGQNAMTSLQECDDAVIASNQEYGVICSRTGLDGWKPTLYTGTRPGRADFGYLGGSSIMDFDDCLQATRLSSERGVCFWGGSNWYVSPIDREGIEAGPFNSLNDCTDYTTADADGEQ